MLFLQNKKLNALAHTIHAHNHNTLTPADTKSMLNTQPQPQTDRQTDRQTDGPLTGTVSYREISRPSHIYTENTDSRLGSQKDANDSFISTFLYRYFFFTPGENVPHLFFPPILPLLFFFFLLLCLHRLPSCQSRVELVASRTCCTISCTCDFSPGHGHGTSSVREKPGKGEHSVRSLSRRRC